MNVSVLRCHSVPTRIEQLSICCSAVSAHKYTFGIIFSQAESSFALVCGPILYSGWWWRQIFKKKKKPNIRLTVVFHRPLRVVSLFVWKQCICDFGCLFWCSILGTLHSGTGWIQMKCDEKISSGTRLDLLLTIYELRDILAQKLGFHFGKSVRRLWLRFGSSPAKSFFPTQTSQPHRVCLQY